MTTTQQMLKHYLSKQGIKKAVEEGLLKKINFWVSFQKGLKREKKKPTKLIL